MPSLPISNIFITLTVVSVIFVSNVADDVPKIPYELVNNVCKKQWNEQFCLEVLKSDTRSEFAKDMTTLTAIALNVATKRVTATRDCFLEVKIGSPAVLKSLNDCIDPYNFVITSFQTCLKEDDCSLIGYDIYIAGDEVRRCQKFADSNGAHDSFITTSNNVTQDYCWLGESLANLMCNEIRS
ncbi:hypothetical protein QVD17_12218 [Tagetes erecta]|uniref:Pectinesterase inhibitor domain-containing protein n=1 Tax=Tagetes erecta TaxID=13708 RepID=A0AAD8L1Z4_TARER|nr:hypothetical protein QVD17_12218 [Tagetes erecta]